MLKGIRLDYSKMLADEPTTGHNRWHPDIPPVLEVDPGEEMELQTRDSLDGQINKDTTTAALGSINLNVAHPLTGPVLVHGARPGDLLEVHIREIQYPEFGYTVEIPGFGLLRDYFPLPYLVRWKLLDGYATSPDLPRVRIPEACFPGVIGVAPSHDLLREMAERETRLAERGGFVLPPEPKDAVPATEPIASEALRTIPPRENGGNLDVRQLTRGTTLFIPVWTEGALFSIGDAHFAQGDSECCGTAIEINATFSLEFELRKGEAARRHIRDAQFSRDEYFLRPEFAVPKRFHATTGLSVGRDGENFSEDATVAAQNALLNMIDHIQERYGYSRAQAYAICSVAVDLKLSEMVDAPNFVVSAFLPLDIFEG